MYKQCSEKKVKNISYNSKLIAQELSIDDRVEKMLEIEAYITVKDHKEGFQHKLSSRLLNPSKSDTGKICKNILDQINKSHIASTNVNQWKNTSTVINWFKNIPNKRQLSFIQFDVENFSLSISLTYSIMLSSMLAKLQKHLIVTRLLLNTLEKLCSSIITSHGKKIW